MVKATQRVSKKIALAFDFDDTLVPDTYDGLLESLGLDFKQFREEKYEALKASGWDSIPARFFSLVEISESEEEKDISITRDYLAEFGRNLRPFDGVEQMFDRLRQRAHSLIPDVELEFYLITSGFVEIARHTSIAKHFKAMWGCEFHYKENGEVDRLKRSLTHAEKPRYLYHISRGVDQSSEQDLLFVYKDVPHEDLAVPMSHIIYVGDGTSDIPCFAMLNQEGGTSIGIFKSESPEDWASEYQPTQSQRVDNLAPADYSEDSEMMQSLLLAVEGICKSIQLEKLSKNE